MLKRASEKFDGGLPYSFQSTSSVASSVTSGEPAAAGPVGPAGPGGTAGPTGPGGPGEESWRGGYATAASRRRMQSAAAWGNGVRWDRPRGKVGRWTRIYPHALPSDDEVP